MSFVFRNNVQLPIRDHESFVPAPADVAHLVTGTPTQNMHPNDPLRSNGKAWLLTFNRRHADWSEYLKNIVDNVIRPVEGCSLITIGNEHYRQNTPGVPPSAFTPHLQVAITFKSAKRWSSVQQLFPFAWIGKAVSADAVHNYCRKEMDYEVIDNRVGRGKRKDIQTLADGLRDGTPVHKMWTQHPCEMVSARIY